jgi:hypothetical protein
MITQKLFKEYTVWIIKCGYKRKLIGKNRISGTLPIL